jgi:thiamine biosynthesis protein ThiS
MEIQLNGREVTLARRCTVEELLRRFRPGGGACAVEVNARLVPRAQRSEQMLCEGDRVEVVTLVGGG